MAAFLRWFRKVGIIGAEHYLSSTIVRSSTKFRCTCSSSSQNIHLLSKRGLIENIFPDNRLQELANLLENPQAMYCGFDPTADSLHIGHLLSLIVLLHGQRTGLSPIAVIGGATAFIGDPSGKTKDRVAIKAEDVEKNIIAITENIEQIINNHNEFLYKGEKKLPEFRIFNNYDWYKDEDLISFLSTTCRHFRVGEMMTKHSVKSRLNSKEGISLTEFIYQVIQANDWLYLFNKYNCSLQIGGNDQMGNVTSGFELINKVTKKYVFGLLVPLILSPGGEKLGKTAGNALWLNPSKTSPFELYQYFFNMPDSVVERYLRLFTFLSLDEIEDAMEEQNKALEKRHGQRKLAEQITILVHGESGLTSALKCTDILFGDAISALTTMTLPELQQLFKSAPTTKIAFHPDLTMFELSLMIKYFPDKYRADEVIKGGGFYLNQQRITDPNHALRDGEHVLPNNITLVRVGKKNYHIVQWII